VANRKVVKASAKHIPYLAAHMREPERAEVWAMAHMTPHEALTRSLLTSCLAWTALDTNGRPMAMLGVGKISLLADEGEAWLLTTDALQEWKVPFAKRSGVYIRRMLREVTVLTNHVDARLTDTISWLKWLGAEFDEPKPYGPDGVLFQRFELRRKK